MNNNVRIAKQLVKLAKSLVAEDNAKDILMKKINENIGKVRGKLQDNGSALVEIVDECFPLIESEGQDAFQKKVSSLLNGKYPDSGERNIVERAFSNAFDKKVKNLL